VVLLGGGAAALGLTPPGRRLLQQAGLAAPPDTATAPRDSTTLAPVVQAPPPAPVETTTVDTPSVPAASPPVRRPAQDPDRAPATQPARTTPPAAPEIGYLTVNADPFGNVFVDNRLAGETPIYTFRVPAGRHVVEIRREGYQTLVDTVLVGSGETVRINRVLTPRQP
jgi:PEGA domain